MASFQTGPPRIIYPDLERFIPPAQFDQVEEWQIRKLVKQRATQMDEISSVLKEKYEDYERSAATAAEHNAVPCDERIPGSDVGAGVDDPELRKCILRATKAASSAVRLPVEPITEEPVNCE